jgi:hypothetical protein
VAKHLADLAEGHFLPHMQVDHAALLLRQLRQRGNERLVVDRRLKPARQLLLPRLQCLFLPLATPQRI